MFPRGSALALALMLPALPTLAQGGSVGGPSTSTTVTVPLADGDTATVTGRLALEQRSGQQFLVLQSPTPYRLVHDHQAGEHAGKIVRDIPIHLAGHDADLRSLAGQTLSAKGHLQFQPASTSWNGALLEATDVVLPGGKQLHSKR